MLNQKTDRIDIAACISKGTAGRVFAWGLFYWLLLAVLTVGSLGIALLLALLRSIDNTLRAGRVERCQQGCSVEVTPEQFPTIHQTLCEYSQRLGLSQPPRCYVVEDNRMNAAALKLRRKHYVILIDDIIEAHWRRNDTDALNFIIAHELAHHALGHTRGIRPILRMYSKALSRLDEESADRVALALTEDVPAAVRAMAVSLVGPGLIGKLNYVDLARQAEAVGTSKKMKKAERYSTHPFTLRRIHYLLREKPDALLQRHHMTVPASASDTETGGHPHSRYAPPGAFS